MTIKTNVILRVKLLNYATEDPERQIDHVRIKLDRHGFPYIIIDNQKIIVNKTSFPFNFDIPIVYLKGSIEIMEGKEELEQILQNQNLTADKLSVRQMLRIA